MSECRAILTDRDIKNYTEISPLDFKCYNVLNYYGEPFPDEECQVLMLKPHRVSLKHHEWKQFQQTAAGKCVAYECRLGCMDRSIVLAFQNASDAVAFKLIMA